MTRLPPAIPERFTADAHAQALSAYHICLRVEASLQQGFGKNGDRVVKDTIYIRILGYLIQFVPTGEGLKTLVTEIVSANSDQAILDVGKMYYDHYIRAFRSNMATTPTPSNQASPRSFDTITDMLNDIMDVAPQSYSTAKKLALYRDGYRCVVTGTRDLTSVYTIKEILEEMKAIPTASQRPDMAYTDCAHIFSEFTNDNSEPGSSKRDYAAAVWAVIQRFGFTQLPDELKGLKVHRLENVMTMVPFFHTLFGQLKVWFVATDEENKYKLEAVDSMLLDKYTDYVTFTSPDPKKFPVPSPVYLAIHAACAKVAHLSGAGDLIDKLYRDMEDSTTLDPSGASAEMLQHAIFDLQAAGSWRPDVSLITA